MGETWLKTSEVAKILRVTSKTVTRYATDQGLPCEETPGGHRRYLEREVLAWVAERAARKEEFRANAARMLRTHVHERPQPDSSTTTPVPAGDLNGAGRPT